MRSLDEHGYRLDLIEHVENEDSPEPVTRAEWDEYVRRTGVKQMEMMAIDCFWWNPEEGCVVARHWVRKHE